MQRTKIKICGLKRPEDISLVNREKPDFVGFVFAKSKRQVNVAQVAALTALLDAGIQTVGVFVDEPAEGILMAVRTCSLNVVQLHGTETLAYIVNLKKMLPQEVLVWKAIRVKNSSSLSEMAVVSADRFLLDAWHPGAAGGNGISFDWTCLQNLSEPYILAGGLTPENVAGAIKILSPWAVDVSSGVEINGMKDMEKLQHFMAAVRKNET